MDKRWLVFAGLLLVTLCFLIWTPSVSALWPSLAALILVFSLRNAVLGLLGGAVIGALLLAGGNPFAVPMQLVEDHFLPLFGSSWKTGAVAFTLLLGGFVHLLERGGILQALFSRLLHGSSARKVEAGAGLFGLVCFFDGLANSLMVGRIFQPLARSAGVNRLRLAYIVDTTSAAVACLAFISTWIAFQLSMIAEGFAHSGREAEPYGLFFASIPFNFYAWFALFLMILAIWCQWNIGAMRTVQADFPEDSHPAEESDKLPVPTVSSRVSVPTVSETNDNLPVSKVSVPTGEEKLPVPKVSSRVSVPTVSDVSKVSVPTGEEKLPVPKVSSKVSVPTGEDKVSVPTGSWWRVALPLVVLVFGIFGGIYIDGVHQMGASIWPVEGTTVAMAFAQARVPGVLVSCSALASLVAFLAFPRGALGAGETVGRVFVDGMLQLFQPVLILLSAWMLSSVLQDLGAGTVLGALLDGRMPLWLLPAAIFGTGMLVSFTTGTSWGTMGLLMPLAIPLVFSLAGSDPAAMALMPIIVGAVFSGAVFGDHCSPLSDTTIVSSVACGVDPVDHVRTQLPYALIAGGLATLAFTLCGGLFS